MAAFGGLAGICQSQELDPTDQLVGAAAHILIIAALDWLCPTTQQGSSMDCTFKREGCSNCMRERTGAAICPS
eukprot:1161531-Pelagomonas_calceolata.AAC.3